MLPEDVFTPEIAIRTAVELAGSDDFGATGWQEGLTRCLEAFARMPLRPKVRALAVDKLIEDLTMRLRIERWYEDHPETNDQLIDGPVFVIGLPRTGTTATVSMMALDYRFRFMRPWEGTQPLPPPVAGEEDRDPRVIAARSAAGSYDKPHVHLYDPDGPEEDLAFLAGLDMHSYHGAFPMPSDYIDWWINTDFRSLYSYHERVLKLLQSRCPPNLWLLKSPPHLFRLNEIVRQYPSAKFVMTHRDPAKLIASVASLHMLLHEERCLPGAIDPMQVGPRHLAVWVEGMRRCMAARAQIGEHRFVDVTNEDVVNRPVETFERIYDHLGMSLPLRLADRVRNYNQRNAPGAFGTHRYAATDFGLTEERIRESFREYIDRFGL